MSTENHRDRIEQTFAVSAKPKLTLSNVRGSITVHSHDLDTIQIIAIKHKKGRRHPERTEIRMHQKGDRVIVKTHHDRLGILQNGKDICAVDYTAHVPTRCDVDLHQVTGTIHAGGVTGHVHVHAVQGSVELFEIDGHTHVKAVNASVDGDKWRGQAKINTVSGPVQVVAAQLSRIRANTVSADLLLETTVDDNGRYHFNSVSGDVTLLLPPENGLESQGSTISGHLVCDLPHQFSRRGKGGWKATINSGGPPVHFNSVSGDLELLTHKPTQV